MTRPSVALIDLEALRGNAEHARALAPASRLMSVVKADGYGHGAVLVARELAPLSDALAVACLEEAVVLREAGIDLPILLLEGAFEAAELPEAARLDLWLTVATEEQLARLEAAKLPRPLTCWLKVDTGMRRLGLAPADVPACLRRLREAGSARDAPVLYTHLASAEILADDTTARQLAAFDAIDTDAARSAANSAGLLAWPRSHYDWVRPGYMLFGNSPLRGPHPNEAALAPVMTLRSAVIALRDVAPGEAVGYGGTWVARRPSRIATVALGYADGYPRQAANGTPVLVDGRRAPLAGRVTMDMLTVDVTDLAGVHVGSEVTLWGAGLPVDEVARHAGAIGYELLARMPARIPRIASAGRTPVRRDVATGR